jgi:uncharacterized protein
MINNSSQFIGQIKTLQLLAMAIVLSGCSTNLNTLRENAAKGDVVSQQELGVIYIKGIGVPQNCAEGIKLLRLAADQGNPDAQLQMSLLYEAGQHRIDKLPTDTAKAKFWRDKAVQGFKAQAKQGNAHAQAKLGNYYLGNFYRGTSDKQKNAKALSWYSRAAEQGDTEAQFGLGTMYQSGWGVKKDAEKAVSWYRKAAAQGNAEAQVRLAGYLDVGLGVKQDWNQALMWRHKAAISDDDYAAYSAIWGMSWPYGNAETYSESYFWRSIMKDILIENGLEKDQNVENYQRMTLDQVRQIKKQVAEWKSLHPKPWRMLKGCHLP